MGWWGEIVGFLGDLRGSFAESVFCGVVVILAFGFGHFRCLTSPEAAQELQEKVARREKLSRQKGRRD